MRRPRVYISGPISKGDREENFRQASEAQRRLIEAGFSPLNPMLTMALDWEVDHAVWIDVDIAWIKAADAILRLPGESAGADLEVGYAVRKGIRVYRDVDELIHDKEVL